MPKVPQIPQVPRASRGSRTPLSGMPGRGGPMGAEGAPPSGGWGNDEGAHATQRWSARLSLAAAALGLLLPMIFAGTASLILLAVGLGGMAVTAAAVWWVLTRRGVIRIAAAVLAVAAPLT